MKTKQKNPPAFPSTIGDRPHQGMTLRDYFAAKAMNGLCADGHTFWDNLTLQGDPLEIARLSYEIADAMLNQREI